MNMKRHSILFFIIAICITIICNACGKSVKPPKPDNEPAFTLKLEPLSDQKIKRESFSCKFQSVDCTHTGGKMRCRLVKDENEAYKYDPDKQFKEKKTCFTGFY